jgi:hypothetical protein
LRERGITHRIARKGVESWQRLGRHRWSIETHHAKPGRAAADRSPTEGSPERERCSLLPPRSVVDHQIDRRHAGSDGKSAAKVGLGLLQHGIVLPLGDGQMREDLVELPAERWGLRPPVRDRLGQPAEREVSGSGTRYKIPGNRPQYSNRASKGR